MTSRGRSRSKPPKVRTTKAQEERAKFNLTKNEIRVNGKTGASAKRVYVNSEISRAAIRARSKFVIYARVVLKYSIILCSRNYKLSANRKTATNMLLTPKRNTLPKDLSNRLNH